MASRIDNITNVPNIESVGTRIQMNEIQITAAVDRYLETLHTDRTTPSSGSDISDFFELLQNSVESKQASERVPTEYRILVVEEDPPEVVDTEAITFFIARRLPGQFDKGPIGAGKVREVTPHHRSTIEHPETPSEKLVTMGKFYDNWITFNIYARTNKTARKRLIWFEQMMDVYNWYFRLYGFRVVEEGSSGWEKVKIDDLTLTKYSVTYMVRTDDTFHFSSQELKDVLLKVEVSNN